MKPISFSLTVAGRQSFASVVKLAAIEASRTLRMLLPFLFAACCAWVAADPCLGQAETELGPAESAPRVGYRVDVNLPLIGDRDDLVRRQILEIADSQGGSGPRPIVVLNFQSSPISGAAAELFQDDGRTRGSQFERCLALARFLTSSEAARVRLIAFVSETVEGHAVLPVLACEEIISAPTAELGRATIDERIDGTIESAYRDITSRRATLPEAAVMAMLDPTAEVYATDLTDGSSRVVDRSEIEKLRDEGQVLSEKTLWQGGGLAAFSGAQMRSFRWIVRTADEPTQLAELLGLSGSLRTTKQLPREWSGVTVSIGGTLTRSQLSQIIRSLSDAVEDDGKNLVVFAFDQTDSDYRSASRLAGFIADLKSDGVYTLGIVRQSLSGPIALAAVACQESVLANEADLGPDNEQSIEMRTSDFAQRELSDLASKTSRPLALLSVLVDPDSQVKEFIQQETGRRSVFANWQVAAQPDADQWLARQKVAGGEPIKPAVALQYGLVDAVDSTPALALSRLGIEELPEELSSPWLESSIQMLLAQAWLPRLLLTIGFFALMAELGNPGIGAGGFLSAVCFLGFFWIEGLNGNVEWLEVLLFVAGLLALALELFVVPGFGVFGIGGLLMLFVSVVLASQTFVWPTNSTELGEVASNLFWTACLALGGMIGLLFMHRQLERLPMLKWVTLHPDDDPAERDYRESITHREHLLGQQGMTTTRLNPSGKAQFGRDIVSVVGSGNLIDEGVAVKVVEVRGNLVIVDTC